MRGLASDDVSVSAGRVTAIAGGTGRGTVTGMTSSAERIDAIRAKWADLSPHDLRAGNFACHEADRLVDDLAFLLDLVDQLQGQVDRLRAERDRLDRKNRNRRQALVQLQKALRRRQQPDTVQLAVAVSDVADRLARAEAQLREVMPKLRTAQVRQDRSNHALFLLDEERDKTAALRAELDALEPCGGGCLGRFPVGALAPHDGRLLCVGCVNAARDTGGDWQ